MKLRIFPHFLPQEGTLYVELGGERFNFVSKR